MSESIARKRGEKLSPGLLWDNVKALVQSSQKRCLRCDDTVLDKRHAKLIELRRQE